MDEPQTVRKRPRPVVSCLRCREKKLKCDRVSPCVNCNKAACPADCRYSQDPGASDRPTKARRAATSTETVDQHPDQRGNDPARAGGTGIIEDLQQRVAKLEELLSARSRPANCDDVPETCIPDASNANEDAEASTAFSGTLVVKGNRTRYHGQNNRTTLLKQFPEAKQYIGRFTEDPVMVGLAKEVQFLQSKSQAPLNSPGSVSDSDFSPELIQLRASLPPKAVCDQLLDIYTQNFEKVLRILHVPSFTSQYTRFWVDPDDETDRSCAFLPLLTAVLTVSTTLVDPTAQLGDPSAWNYLENTAVNLIRTWQRKLGRKQHTELATLQVGVLVTLNRRLRLESDEEIWRATGTLVRSAMVMGLHVDLSGYSKLSAFQAETRRRLWITIAEMDLQASVESGMPVMTPDLDYRALSPANLDDADFDESTAELPPPKPLHERTDSLAQVTLAISLSQRIKAMVFVKNTGPTHNLSATLEHGRVLEEQLQQIPDLLKLDRNPPDDDTPASLLNRVLLDIHIRRSLLCLYRPVAMKESQEADYHTLQQSCLESSLAILSYQDLFDPSVADLDLFTSSVYSDLFQSICKNDLLRAALSVCGYMKTSGKNPHTPASNSSVGLAKQTPMHSKASLTRIVEATLDALTRRVAHPGSNVKDIILLAIVLQSVRARSSSQVKDHWMQEGAKKAFSACRQHLFSSVTDESVAGNIADLAQLLQSSQALFPSGDATGLTPHAQLPDLLGQSSALLDEFNDFQGNLFQFDDGPFAWNP
ncbi:Zn2Cys6 transcription factor [Aspergillus steynii IBT 23096]|uniref:Zn2Cys6 transcription factor n=1 Tax=Aspergillus steynii IBT 23096 TaxID=1392250 RepID=A0A2I2GMF5_9EURO|nr:Zn2Cys6 transcription factor [Aspergillus steynii IBT 23096]PLB54057.1 Zn2Cys6 transcription factor [Aspergillus steynii IBT 23096]